MKTKKKKITDLTAWLLAFMFVLSACGNTKQVSNSNKPQSTGGTTEVETGNTEITNAQKKGLTQSQLAEMCNVTQPVIARMESSVHSPQIDSLLKIFTPLGYTLQIVPTSKKDNYGKENEI